MWNSKTHTDSRWRREPGSVLAWGRDWGMRDRKWRRAPGARETEENVYVLTVAVVPFVKRQTTFFKWVYFIVLNGISINKMYLYKALPYAGYCSWCWYVVMNETKCLSSRTLFCKEGRHLLLFSTKLCLTLHNPMDCSMLGFPVPHCLPEFVHWIGDAIQTSHTLLPSSSAFNLSHHQGLFQWTHCD